MAKRDTGRSDKLLEHAMSVRSPGQPGAIPRLYRHARVTFPAA